MAIGGRNTAASWIFAVLIIGLIGFILWVASPMLPAVGDWIAGAVDFFLGWLRSITPQQA